MLLLWLVASVFVVIVDVVFDLCIISLLRVVVGLVGVATSRPLFVCLCVLSGLCIAVVWFRPFACMIDIVAVVVLLFSRCCSINFVGIMIVFVVVLPRAAFVIAAAIVCPLLALFVLR